MGAVQKRKTVGDKNIENAVNNLNKSVGSSTNISSQSQGGRASTSSYTANPNGAFNTSTDWRFVSPTNGNPNNANKDTERLRSMGGGSDVTGISTAERLYRANNRKASTNYGGTGYNFGGIGTIGGFAASEAYQKAMAYTNSLLEQLNGGRTAYSDKIDALMSQIEGRDKFSYDFNTDPLFQNALASAMQSGQNAMQDTIGQASNLTGGYGSSYATSAANQVYNAYIQDAYSSLPDYYNIALNAYNQEGQDLYNQLGMYQTADATAYDRLYNAYSANLANAQNLYSQEYNNYWDTANYNLTAQKYNADYAYKNAQLAQSQKQYETDMAYQQYRDSVSDVQTAAKNASKNSTADTSETLTLKQKDLASLQEAFSTDVNTGLNLYNTYLPTMNEADKEAVASMLLELGIDLNNPTTNTNKWSLGNIISLMKEYSPSNFR